MPAPTCRIIHVQWFADKIAVLCCTQGAAEHWKSVKLFASKSLLQAVLMGDVFETERGSELSRVSGCRVKSTALPQCLLAQGP